MEKKEILKIKGMGCTSCALRIENTLKKLKGVKEIQVNFLEGKALLKYDSGVITLEKIIEKIKEAGYDAIEFKNEKLEEEKEIETLKKKFITGFISGFILLILSYTKFLKPEQNLLFQFLIATPCLFYISSSIFKNAFKSIFKKRLNMDVMYSIGIGSAYISSLLSTLKILPENYVFYEATSFLAGFLLLGKFLERIAMRKTRRRVQKLIEMSVKEVTVLKDGEEKKLKIEDVIPGDIFLVKPGEKIPLDGIIIDGESFVDESMIRGEPLPTFKEKGDDVIGGTINKSGVLKIKATKGIKDAYISSIIKLVQEAINSKPPIQKVMDKILIYFIPSILTFAFFSYIYWLIIGEKLTAFISFISVLVIACPCAFGLATPLAITLGIGKGAQNGILIKNGDAIEILGKVTAFIFDKTGTLTKGIPSLNKIILYDIENEELLFYSGSILKNSNHPLAKAVIDHLKDLKIKLEDPEEFEEVIGKGLKGKVFKKEIMIGKEDFLLENGVEFSRDIKAKLKKLEEEGKTFLIISIGKKIKGIIEISDEIREEAALTVMELKKKGKKVFMITGDNERNAEEVAKKLGIDNFFSKVLPHQKLEIVKKIKEKEVVCFIGDGINDAPALVEADIGIAMGRGQDVAIESADIILTRDNLYDIIRAINLSNKIFSKIKTNLFWALIYNIILIPFAAGFFYFLFKLPMRPEWSALAMALSSFSVVMNSILLEKYKV